MTSARTCPCRGACGNGFVLPWNADVGHRGGDLVICIVVATIYHQFICQEPRPTPMAADTRVIASDDSVASSVADHVADMAKSMLSVGEKDAGLAGVRLEKRGTVEAAAAPPGHFTIHLPNRMSLTVDVMGAVVYGVVLCSVGLILYCRLGAAVLPGGGIFAIVYTVGFSNIVAGTVARLFGLPALVGLIIGGIMASLLAPFPDDVPPAFSSVVRTFAVVLIVSRAGMQFTWKVIRPVITTVLSLGSLPQLAEVTGHFVACLVVFQPSNWMFALFQAAAASPVSNAIVIPVTAPFRAEGYSQTRGPLPVMIISAAFDNILAVWLLNLSLTFAFPAPGFNPLTEVLVMPFLLGGAAAAGVICGQFLCYCVTTRFANLKHELANIPQGSPDTPTLVTFLRAEDATAFRRETLLLLIAANGAAAFFTAYLKLPIWGIVFSVVNAATVSQLLASNPDTISARLTLNNDLAWTWDTFITPTLFSILGSQLDVAELLNPSLLGRALSVLFCGLLMKWIVVVATTRRKLAWSEVLYACIGWASKATIQSASAPLVLLEAQKMLDATPINATDYTARQADVDSGRVVMDCLIFYVLFCSFSAAVALKALGRTLLIKDSDQAPLQ